MIITANWLSSQFDKRTLTRLLDNLTTPSHKTTKRVQKLLHLLRGGNNNNDSKYDYIIFHKNCLDGTGALMVADMAGLVSTGSFVYADNPDKHQGSPLPPKIENKRVLALDINWPPSYLKRVIDTCKSIDLIDHHTDGHGERLKLETLYKAKFIYTYNETHSACVLTWHTFFPDQPVPKFLEYLQDNDLRSYKIKETSDVILGLEVLHNANLGLDRVHLQQKVDSWKAYIEKPELIRAKLEATGKVAAVYKQQLLEKTSNNWEIVDVKAPSNQVWKVLVSNVGNHIGRFLAPHLKREHSDVDAVIVWYYDIKLQGIRCTVRSKNDIRWLTTRYGGGGHKHAAPFKFKCHSFYEWLEYHNKNYT